MQIGRHELLAFHLNGVQLDLNGTFDARVKLGLVESKRGIIQQVDQLAIQQHGECRPAKFGGRLQDGVAELVVIIAIVFLALVCQTLGFLGDHFFARIPRQMQRLVCPGRTDVEPWPTVLDDLDGQLLDGAEIGAVVGKHDRSRVRRVALGLLGLGVDVRFGGDHLRPEEGSKFSRCVAWIKFSHLVAPLLLVGSR